MCQNTSACKKRVNEYEIGKASHDHVDLYNINEYIFRVEYRFEQFLSILQMLWKNLGLSG